jgi:hypothetical protein
MRHFLLLFTLLITLAAPAKTQGQDSVRTASPPIVKVEGSSGVSGGQTKAAWNYRVVLRPLKITSLKLLLSQIPIR